MLRFTLDEKLSSLMEARLGGRRKAKLNAIFKNNIRGIFQDPEKTSKQKFELKSRLGRQADVVDLIEYAKNNNANVDVWVGDYVSTTPYRVSSREVNKAIDTFKKAEQTDDKELADSVRDKFRDTSGMSDEKVAALYRSRLKDELMKLRRKYKESAEYMPIYASEDDTREFARIYKEYPSVIEVLRKVNLKPSRPKGASKPSGQKTSGLGYVVKRMENSSLYGTEDKPIEKSYWFGVATDKKPGFKNLDQAYNQALEFKRAAGGELIQNPMSKPVDAIVYGDKKSKKLDELEMNSTAFQKYKILKGRELRGRLPDSLKDDLKGLEDQLYELCLENLKAGTATDEQREFIDSHNLNRNGQSVVVVPLSKFPKQETNRSNRYNDTLSPDLRIKSATKAGAEAVKGMNELQQEPKDNPSSASPKEKLNSILGRYDKLKRAKEISEIPGEETRTATQRAQSTLSPEDKELVDEITRSIEENK